MEAPAAPLADLLRAVECSLEPAIAMNGKSCSSERTKAPRECEEINVKHILELTSTCAQDPIDDQIGQLKYYQTIFCSRTSSWWNTQYKGLEVAKNCDKGNLGEEKKIISRLPT